MQHFSIDHDTRSWRVLQDIWRRGGPFYELVPRCSDLARANLPDVLARVEEARSNLEAVAPGIPAQLDEVAARGHLEAPFDLPADPATISLCREFLYWKYRGPLARERGAKPLPIDDVRRVFGLVDLAKGESPNYAGAPARVSAPCMACGGRRTFVVAYHDKWYRPAFKCESCGHTSGGCSCSRCSEHYAKDLHLIPGLTVAWLDELKAKVVQAGANRGFSSVPPDRSTMEADFATYHSRLDRDVQAFLRVGPGRRPLKECIDRVATMFPGAASDAFRSGLLAKLVASRIVYPVLRGDAWTGVRHVLAAQLVQPLAESKGFDTTALDTLLRITDADFSKVAISRTGRGFKVRCDDIALSIAVDAPSLTAAPDNLDYTVNAAYTDEVALPRSTRGRQGHLCLFNSGPERAEYCVLTTQRPGAIVQVNRLLRQCFDLKLLKPGEPFSESEIGYLSKCVLDFVIYDADGFPLEIVELNKGKHHVEPEWIAKDELKQRAVEYFGVWFRREY